MPFSSIRILDGVFHQYKARPILPTMLHAPHPEHVRSACGDRVHRDLPSRGRTVVGETAQSSQPRPQCGEWAAMDMNIRVF